MNYMVSNNKSKNCESNEKKKGKKNKNGFELNNWLIPK